MPLYRPSQKPHASVPARTAGQQSDPSSHSIEELPIRVVIAMAAELERMGWGIIVSNQSDMRLIAQAASCSEVLKLLKAQRADVTLIDEAMLGPHQCKDLREYSRQPRSSRFILVAPHEKDYSLEQSPYAFTHAYLLKGVSATELLSTIRATAGADHP
jgi:DNA-binding NarL/FixJ family response regulator